MRMFKSRLLALLTEISHKCTKIAAKGNENWKPQNRNYVLKIAIKNKLVTQSNGMCYFSQRVKNTEHANELNFYKECNANVLIKLAA